MAGSEDIPERIGRFPIVRSLGRGGMGVVYEGKDEALGRRLAIKVLHDDATDTGKQRFVREARAIAAIAHPNVATVFEVGELGDDGDDGLYLAMEFIEGDSLRAFMRDGPPPIERTLEIARDVLSALTAAHEAGLVHRDLKPENVMIETRSGSAKVLDFGLAKSAARAAITAKLDAPPQADLVTGLTSENSIVGSPGYMSPEQIRGEPVGPRSDLYSFGVVLYEMLAGKRPIERATPMLQLAAIVTSDPTPIETHRDDLPDELRELVMSCVARSKEERPKSAAAIRAALDMMIPSTRSQPNIAMPPPPSAGAAWVKWALGLAVAVALFAILIPPMFEPESDETTTAPERRGSTSAPGDVWVIAVVPFSVNGPEDLAYLGEAVSHSLATKLELEGAIRAVDPRSVDSHFQPGLDPTQVAEHAAEVGATHVVLGNIVAAGGRLEVVATLYDQGGERVAAFEREGEESELLVLTEQLAASLLAQRGDLPNSRLIQAAANGTSSVEAMRAYIEGERAYQAREYERARDGFSRAVGEDPEFALAYYRLSAAEGWLDDTGAELAALEQALSRRDHLSPRERGLVDAYQCYLQSDYACAMRRYRAHVRSYPTELEAWIWLAETQFHFGPQNGRPRSGSRETFERALELEAADTQALEHLIELTIEEADVDRVEELVARLPEEVQPQYEVVFALLRGDEVPAAEPPTDIGAGALADVPFLEGLLYLSEHEPERPGAQVRNRLAYELAHGRNARALELFERAAERQERGQVEGLTLLLLLPTFHVTDAQIERICEVAREPREPPATERRAWHHGVRPQVLAFLGAACAHRLGDERARSASLEQLAALPEGEGFERLGRTMVAQLEAWIALDAGEPARALTLLEEPSPIVPIGQALASPILSGALGLYVRGEALIALGRAEEALPWLESERRATSLAAPITPYVRRRTADVHAAAGRHAEAHADYERYLRFRREVDPVYDEEVAEVRRTLAALTP